MIECLKKFCQKNNPSLLTYNKYIFYESDYPTTVSNEMFYNFSVSVMKCCVI